MDPKSKRVGTGLVGAPACGDVMKLQIEVFSLYLSVFIDHNPNKCFEMLTFSLCPLIRYVNIVNLSIYLIFLIFVVNMSDKLLWIVLFQKVDDDGKIVDAKFKTFGCGSAIASSRLDKAWWHRVVLVICAFLTMETTHSFPSLATEWIKGKQLSDAAKIKNSDIAKVSKLHICSKNPLLSMDMCTV